MPRALSREQREAALVALTLHGGNVSRAAREAHVSRRSVERLRDGVRNLSRTEKKGAEQQAGVDYGALWAGAELKVVRRVEELIPVASFRDLSIFAGIAADKHLEYTQGRKGGDLHLTQEQKTIIIVDQMP